MTNQKKNTATLFEKILARAGDSRSVFVVGFLPCLTKWSVRIRNFPRLVAFLLIYLMGCFYFIYSLSAQEPHQNAMLEKMEQEQEAIKPESTIDLRLHCYQAYQQTAHCPHEMCVLKCSGDIEVEACEFVCLPRSCVELSVEHCPQHMCQVIDGCGGEKVCYHRLKDEEEPSCGGLAYTGVKECCQGLVKRCGLEFFDGTCDMIGQNSIYSVPSCIPCGNGICNQFENACNCPEDCKKNN